MNHHTRRSAIAGPAGAIECATDEPTHGAPRGLAVLCHPHPVHGGTMDNKIVQTLTRTLVAFGDGIESDRLELTWGQSATMGVAGEALRLVV